MLQIKELCKYMEIKKCGKWLQGKKLLSCTDLPVVEASKVVNKLLTETGFSFILTT